MQYDPIKRSLGKVFNNTPLTRKVFYHLLDLLLLRAWHIKRELRHWLPALPTGASFLDAGSGFGQYVYYVGRKRKDINIIAIDVKEEQIADCTQFFGKIGFNKVKFKVEDLTTINFDGLFDFILCVDVMEHIEEDVKVLQNYYRALKPGGKLLISTPSDLGGSDVHNHDHSEGAVGFVDEHVRDGYGIKELENKLLTAGFTRSEVRYQYGKPGKLSWKLSMKFPILILNTTRLFFVVLPLYYLITFPVCLVLNALDVRIKHKSGTGIIALAHKD